jgi:valyl-tRNA synthetase
MIASPAGNDLLFDESSLEQGRNFNNKLWNALKLVKMWQSRQSPIVSSESADSSTHHFALDWFENRLNEVKAEVDSLMKQFRLSEALKTIYSLIWDDFCSWYLEWVKPGFEQPIETKVYKKTIEFFAELMQILHPYMPFVTEEIYHLLEDRTDDLCVKQLDSFKSAEKQILLQGNLLKEVITGIRDVRNKNQIKPKEQIQLHIHTASAVTYQSIESILAKQLNAKAILYVKDKVNNCISAVIGNDKFYIESEQPINTASQKDDLVKDLEHQKGFLLSIEKKLSNEKFVANAKPEVLAMEQKKKADTLSRIKAIEESLAAL